MAAGLFEVLGEDVFCSIGGGGQEARFALTEARPKLQGWAKRYDRASGRDDEGELAAIGREMFEWLDGSGWGSAWADSLGGDRELEIRVRGRGGPDEIALLDAPWELLARADGPLALDDMRLFIVARRVGDVRAPLPAEHADLQLMFMAAAPQGQHELDFEAEEAAILEATKRLPLRLVVEETGNKTYLGERLTSDEGPFEALHLSCHGDIDPALGPILLLEDAEGRKDRSSPGAIVEALGADPPLLVFLSACRTAEYGRGSPGAGGGEPRREAGEGRRGPDLATPFARQLATRIANVLGWDGSVYDTDASAFATHFYKELAGRSSVQRAAAAARRQLLRSKLENPQRGRHWHLARVYLGPQGGGPLCARGGKRRAFDAARAEKAFLDRAGQRVPVATRSEFVGRRRSIQAVLRAFRDGPNGVLIHGMGALGKSSLAARVVSRMPQHTPVVVFERYDALSVFDAISDALDPRIRPAECAEWHERVKTDPAALCLTLESWLSGPLDERPILLVVDDLERILETPSQSDALTGVREDYRSTLGAALSAFERAPTTRSRLVLTSRYDFRLSDGRGNDRAAGLVRVHLRPMDAPEREKQWRAAGRMPGREAKELGDEETALLSRALEAAGGNPGLQAILTEPILSGNAAEAQTGLDQIDVYRTTGEPPKEIQEWIEAGSVEESEQTLPGFFKRVSFATYRDALTEDQARQLSAATLFSLEIPIPLLALGAAGQALGVEAPRAAIARLIGLGLFDDWGEIGGVAHAAANPLAWPLASPIDPADRLRLARAAMSELARAWRDGEGEFPIDPRGLEAAEVALAAQAEPEVLEAAVLAGAAWLEQRNEETRRAHALIAAAIAAIPGDYAFGPNFLRLALECADALGEADLIKTVLDAHVRPPSGNAKARAPHAAFDLRRAEQMIRAGRIAEAEALTREAQSEFRGADDDRGAAIAFGQIADILQSRGDLDEALRIRREEQLPVFERLGDVRSRAATMGQIADILQSRGDLDEALRIRREEQLPVFERLGDVRSRAVTMGQIADILQRRGDLDEALRIRREEELPVYDRLGDVRERAVTIGKIADILQRRGGLDEALRILRQEQLPVYERLGDVRERALAMGRIADILESRGDLDEALRIRREEELPVYERIGDVHSRAATMGQIADILQRRGDLDEALRIRREEQLPVYERLGNLHQRAVIMGKIADILQSGGDLDEALRILQDEVLPVFDRLGNVRSRAVALQQIASALLNAGGVEKGRIQEIYEALAESFAIFARLGAPDGIASVGALLAQVLAIGGHRDEALAVLDQAEAAFRKLGDAGGIEHVQQLRRTISGQ